MGRGLWRTPEARIDADFAEPSAANATTVPFQKSAPNIVVPSADKVKSSNISDIC